MSNKHTQFTVWYDTELKEHIAVESSILNFKTLRGLDIEGIKPERVFAATRSDAIGQVFPHLQKFEKPLSNKKYTPKLRVIK